MTRIDKFKEYLGSGEKIFLEEYEPAINELLDNLNQDGLLKTYFTPTRIARLQKLMRTSNAAAHLFNNANKIFAHDDEEKINSNMRKLEELGLGLEVDVEQYITILCHMYQVTSERLKLHLNTLNLYDGETSHSSRRGCAITLRMLGVDDQEINKHVGWGSKRMVDHYASIGNWSAPLDLLPF